MIALSTLFLPHYLGTALGVDALRESPWDIVIAVVRDRSRSPASGSCGARSSTRRARRRRARPRDAAPARDPRARAALLAGRADAGNRRSASSPTWDDLAFALPLAMLAYTGLETVANLAEETREPGRTLPRSLFSAIGLVVVLTAADRGRRALRLPGRERPDGARRGVAEGAARRHRRGAPGARSRPGRRRAASSTSASPVRSSCSRRRRPRCRASRGSPTRSASTGSCRASFGRLNRRTLVSPQAIVAAAAISIALVIGTGAARRRRRVPRQPLLVRRPARLRGGAARGDPAARSPSPTCRGRSGRRSPRRCIGAPLAIAFWLVAMVTHPAARYAGPVWLALGLVALPRRPPPRAHRSSSREVEPVEQLPPGAEFQPRARADEARADRRGDGGDGRRAREGARGAGSTRSS